MEALPATREKDVLALTDLTSAVGREKKTMGDKEHTFHRVTNLISGLSGFIILDFSHDSGSDNQQDDRQYIQVVS